MKEVFSYYAKCNDFITERMFDIIDSSPDSFLYQSNGYYKSIYEIANHVYISNINWLKDFSVVIESKVREQLKSIVIPEYGTYPLSNLEEARNGLMHTTRMSMMLCGALTDQLLFSEISKKRKNGDIVTQIVWKALIHYFNHQTHHRGQISEILDELKIENDYSNMIFIS